METFSLILVQWADHGSRWVPCAMGQWYRYIIARVSSLLPCSFYSHPSKDKPKSNDMLTVIRFRVSYVHLSQILIFKKRKYHKEIEKKYLGITMRSLGFQDFQQCCFRSPDWWSNSTHWMGLLFLAIFLMVHLDSSCLVIPLAGPSPKLGPQLFRKWTCSSGTNWKLSANVNHFSNKKMSLEMLSAKYRPFCLGRCGKHYIPWNIRTAWLCFVLLWS